MKGGITSGVVYPQALCAIGATYRIRGIGGASAGAIGAAAGAAAEFGRASSGYERLEAVPSTLGGGKLATLFQPQPSTRSLLRLMLVATGGDRPGPKRTGLRLELAVLAAMVASFPWASLIGALPGTALAIFGVVAGGWTGWFLAVAGVLLLIGGWAVAVTVCLLHKLTVDVPANLFGICRGLGEGKGPGFTDWLTDLIDDIAGLAADARPLRFGQLWSGDVETLDPAAERRVDLRMITTCLSEGRPYEMPWEARRFFFDPETWRSLFPPHVVEALETAPPPTAPDGDDDEEWRWEERIAGIQTPPLRRLPDPQHLPVIVATRLSLSFPLLIAAVPLWTIDRRHQQTRGTMDRYREARKAGTKLPASGLVFSKEWFTDGGFCSNFPVHLFDATLPSRPTFAINLGRFPEGQQPDPDQRKNVEWARDNRALSPVAIEIPESGFASVGAFASAAVNTARNWQDSSYLDQPGFRDRIVRVLQTKSEGGLNLHMDADQIEGLSDRGHAAASAIVAQFTEPRYPKGSPEATGWDNHRWVRYRALLSLMPEWLESYQHGRAVLEIDPTDPPSYKLSTTGRDLAERVGADLDRLAQTVGASPPGALVSLTEAPRPKGAIRRIPQS